MPKKSKKLNFDDLLVVGFLLLLITSPILYILRKIGIVEPLKIHVTNKYSPKFNNEECLLRHSYRVREADPLIPDDDLDGVVARACALERGDFEGW